MITIVEKEGIASRVDGGSINAFECVGDVLGDRGVVHGYRSFLARSHRINVLHGEGKSSSGVVNEVKLTDEQWAVDSSQATDTRTSSPRGRERETPAG